MIRPGFPFLRVLFCCALLFAVSGCFLPTKAQVAGQNVNMVSGTNWTNGDPFLQRQNEPSIAVSSRNSSHLLAGSNDYRTVDLPGLLGIDERGDAWLGLFKSFDGGRTWQSTLLPGFPLDGSIQGQGSPIHGFQAASDPTVRAGTNGLFYYTGLAFNRGNNSRSAVFVSRFIDLNNKENGNAGFESGSMTNLQPRDTIKYLDTTAVAQGIVATGPNSFPTFLDKPWVATDIPRGSSTCTISVDEDGKTITQTIPAAPVYMTYTSFDVTRQFSTINFIRSLDCGATWSSPTILSRNDEPSNDAEHQGTVIAIDPSVPPSQPATVYVAWRRFASANDPGDPPAIFLAKSADGGAHWGAPFAAVVFPNFCIPSIQNPNPTNAGCPFDQVFTNASFRSNGYPALTVDSIGRVYVAWSQRDANGDGKIMMGIAPGGRSIQSSSIAAVDLGTVTDNNGNVFSNLSGRGSQLMPSLTFAAGKLVLTYYDLRQDHTTGTFLETPSPNCDPLLTLPCGLGGQYAESRTLEGELAPPNPSNNSAVFDQYVADSSPLTVRRHTIDVMGAEAVPPPASSLQPPSFKAFRVTNYLFGSIPQLFPDVEQMQFNAPNLPLFVEGTAPFMGDYIDVAGTPQIIPDGNGGWTFNTDPSSNPVFHAAWTDNRDVVPPADGNWQNYTPPISASNVGASKFDPTKTPPSCVVGQTGMRNQNIYTAEISQGVILTSPQTSKPVLTPDGQPIQRAFVVEVRNATNSARSFQITIPTQPATATASFSQFSSLTTQTVNVNAFSSQSFPVFVVANAGSTVAFPSVLVTATENDGTNPPLTGSVLLNPDPTNPALASPDNAAIGGNQVSINEFYNPGVANPGVANSGLPNPGVANPGVANPGVANPGVANPTVVLALNPGVANPGVANPGVANPGVANPGVANESVTDASYSFTNEGNTSASYSIQFFQSAPFPAGAKFQIILSKLYFTQQVAPDSCQLGPVATNVIIANITNPVFVTDPTQLGNPGVANLGVQTPTINLAPGESGQVTIRTNLSVAQVASQVLPNVSPVAVSRAVNTIDVQKGIFTPPINLLITSTSASVAIGVVGQTYNTTLTSIGGNTGPRIWTIAAGSLPPGLQLNAASGAISGTPTQGGSFTFTAQVMDTGAPQHTAARALTATVNVLPLVFTSSTIPTAVVGRPYVQALPVVGGTQPYNATVTSGTLPPGLLLTTSGVLNGTPSGTGTFSFTVTVTDSSTPTKTATQTLTITANTLVITTTVLPNGIVGVPYSAAINTAGGTLPLSFSLATAAFPPGLLIQPAPASSSGALAGTPTLAGTYSFSESVVDSSSPIQTATQNYVVTIAPVGTPAPAKVAFVSQPQNSIGGQTLSGSPVVVSVADATSAPISGVTVAMSLNGTPPCAAATLGGAVSAVTDGSGNATFSNLSMDRGQVGYMLLASAGSASAVSSPFNVEGFCNSANLSTQRELHTQVLLGTGKVLIAGGIDNLNNAVNTAELYDPATGTTSPTGNLSDPNGRVSHISVLLPNGKVLLAGGQDNISGALTTAELYDPAAGTFSPTGSMMHPRALAEAVLLADGRVLVTGGNNTNVGSNTAEIYDPATGLWTPTGNMTQGRIRHRMTLLPNGKVLVTGGRDAALNFFGLSSAELFDPFANQGAGGFTAIGNMNSVRFVHGQSLLSNGTVLVAGGFDNTGLSVTSAEIFDPATNLFTLTGNMNIARSRHSSTLLPDGSVLETGGIDSRNGFAPPAPAELYLPTGGSFALTGSMTTGRELAGATLLPNANVLVSGGDDAVNVLNSTEVYYNTAPVSPLVITTASVPNGTISQPYVQMLLEQGGLETLTWSLVSGTLPTGINLSANGILSGTPTPTGSFTFTVQVADSSTPARSATASFTINVSLTPLAFTSNTMPAAGAGRPYSQPLPVVGGTQPYTTTVTSGTLPPGLALGSNGVLSGTPSSAGSFTFTASVSDSSTPVQTATQTLTIAVNTLFITTTALPGGMVGVPYNAVISTTGGTLPLTFSAATAAFPPGLAIQQPAANSQNGALAGTPTTAGHFTFAESVVDSSTPAQTATQYYVMDISPAGTTGVPASAIFLSQPQNSVGGQILTGSPIRVRFFDASNTPVVGASVAMSFNGAPPCSTAVLSGTLTAVTNVNGVAVFPDLSIDRGQPGYTLLASAGSASAVSQPFTVSGSCVTTTVPAGSHILFNIQPPGPMGGGSTGLQAVVQLFDANNSPIAGVQLSASFGAKPCPDAALSGTLTTITDSNGLAVFSGITSNRGGNGYTGVATATSNPQVFAASIPFNIQGFCPTGNLTTLRREDTVVLLPNGKVLILGGLNSNSVSAATPLNTAELYDPATGVFTPTGNMTTTRDLAAATVLPNGKVLVVGGKDATGATLASAELYDPTTGQFTQTGSMASPRQEHAATLLPNGKVLISGGDRFPGFIFTPAELYDPATGTFTSTGAMNTVRASHTATLLSNGMVLLTGGLTPNQAGTALQLTASAELYNPSTGVFTPTGSMAMARENHAATMLSNGTVLVSGGYSAPQPSVATASAELYDPATGTFSPTGNMNVARAEHTSTLLPNGTVLIGGGFSSGGFFAGTELSTAEIYNPLSGNFRGFGNMAFAHSRIVAPLLPNGAVLLASGTTAELFFPTDPPFLVQEFTTTGNLNTARELHTATLLKNGLVLIAGGADSSGAALASAELYNPVTETSTATGSLNTARVFHTATLLSNGLVLIAGGTLNSSGSSISSASAELFNPATGTSTATGSLNSARAYHTATLLNNGLVLVAGGLDSSGTSSATAELYNPATGTFTATGSLNTARILHTATLLNNGLVLIAGGLGTSSGPFLANAELYNPATGTFTATASLNTARDFHTATLLSNGLVLIAGGLASSGLPLASAELYNPATGAFIATGSLNAGRWAHTATLLSNGLVLIAGGFSSSVGALASAELYDPASGTFTATGNPNSARFFHTATLVPTGKVLVAGGAGALATSELYQFGANQQLQPQSCSYEGHIKSVAALSTPAAIQFVNASTTLTFQVFWLDYNGNRVLYATLSPGQSYVQQTFLTHPWVIADTSPAATCQHIYLPLPEQAPAIFP